MTKDTQDRKDAMVKHIAIGLFLKKYPRLKAEDWPKDTVLQKEFIADAADLEWWIRTQAPPAPSQDRERALAAVKAGLIKPDVGYPCRIMRLTEIDVETIIQSLQSPRPRDDAEEHQSQLTIAYLKGVEDGKAVSLREDIQDSTMSDNEFYLFIKERYPQTYEKDSGFSVYQVVDLLKKAAHAKQKGGGG